MIPSRGRDAWRHTLLVIAGLLLIAPALLMLVISVKSRAQFATQPIRPTWPLHFGNYALAWDDIGRPLVNSVITSAITAALVTFLGALSAYVFAFFDFPMRRTAYYAYLALLMIPSVLTLVPTFEVVRDLGLLNSWMALILPWTAVGQVSAIFIIRTYFESVAVEVLEAARIDGASELRIFLSIAVPIAKPILAIVVVFNVLATWNDVIWPLVTLQSQDLFVLPLGLLQFRDTYSTSWGPLMAAYTLASLPLLILFLCTSRAFVEGADNFARKRS